MTLENAYIQGDKLYTDVDGVPYLVDTGADVSMTTKKLEPLCMLEVITADGKTIKMKYAEWKGIFWIFRLYDLVSLRDLKHVGTDSKLLEQNPPKVQMYKMQWFKEVNIPETTDTKIRDRDLSMGGKHCLGQILSWPVWLGRKMTVGN